MTLSIWDESALNYWIRREAERAAHLQLAIENTPKWRWLYRRRLRSQKEEHLLAGEAHAHTLRNLRRQRDAMPRGPKRR